MLWLNNDLLKTYTELMDSVTIEDTSLLYDALETYHRMITKPTVISTNLELNSILDWVENTVIETFDYRNDEFESNVISLSETMSDLPDSILFDPIFKMLDKSQYYMESNIKLFIEHDINGMNLNSNQIDAIFNMLGVTECISITEMESYKRTVESEMFNLTNIMLLEKALSDSVRDDVDNSPSHKKPDYTLFDIDSDLYHAIDTIYNEETELSLDTLVELLLMDIKSSPIQILCNSASGAIIKNHNEFESFICYSESICALVYDSVKDMSDLLTLNEFKVEIDHYIDYLINYPCRLTLALIKILTMILCILDKDRSVYYRGKIGDLLEDSDSICSAFNLFSLYQNKLRGITYNGKTLSIDDRDYWDEDYHSENDSYSDFSEESYVSENYSSYIDSDTDQIHSMNALAEMFEVRRDGSIKVELKDRTTFMNEYAINHRLLKLNHSQGDIEGMKYNLVYHMILVDSIERNILYNDRISHKSKIYKDAKKARQFALNDISTYLPIIKKAEPSFNMNEFYKQVKADKNTIEINTPDVISGIKNILKAIAL